MRKLGNEWKKGVSLIMATLLVCGSIQVPVRAKETESRIIKNAISAVEKLNPEMKAEAVELSDQDKKQLAKEETVYVIANADGSPEKLIVSDWLKNTMGSKKLEDTTELTNITNVKGTESFDKKEGSLGIWDAAGNDIYYRGSIEKELPVELKVTYQLNGRNVSPGELAGQSGKVNIHFDYINQQKETVMVGDKEEELYVPFVIMTSLVLDNENFKNIEVSNGKIINDGERTIVVGYAMPGLKDNLDIGSEGFDVEELDIPEYVEVTADVTGFELATTLSVATNEVFGDMDIDVQEKMDDLSADMDDLQEAMNELMDGTAKLYDGVLELYDGTGELTDGIGELNDGAKELNDGAGELRDGAKDLYDGAGALKFGAGELAAGMANLSAGLNQLAAQNQTLLKGAEMVFNSLLATANAQLAGTGIPTLTIENYSEVLSAAIKAAPEKSSAQQDEEDVVEEIEPEETEDVEAIPSDVDGETSDTTDAQQESISEPVSEAEEDSLAYVLKKDLTLVGASKGVDSSQTQEARGAADALIALKAQLDSYNTFYQGLKAYTAGVALASQGAQQLLTGARKLDSGAAELKDGAKKLKDGAGELMDGTGELKDGAQELKDGGQELKDGVIKLRDGSEELKDGTIEFNDEGIQKLLDMFNGDLQELSDRLDAIKSAAKGYQSFSGISDGVQGNVRFIYKTAAIEK